MMLKAYETDLGLGPDDNLPGCSYVLIRTNLNHLKLIYKINILNELTGFCRVLNVPDLIRGLLVIHHIIN